MLFVQDNVGAPDEDIDVIEASWARSNPVMKPWGGGRQQFVSTRKTGGANLGMATFFRAPAPLSERIDKIYTLLSTGFVENAHRPRAAILRNPLPDAEFEGMAPVPLGARR